MASSLAGLTKATALAAALSSTFSPEATWSVSNCIDGSPGTLDDASSPTCATTANPAQTNSLSLQVQSGIRVGLTTVR